MQGYCTQNIQYYTLHTYLTFYTHTHILYTHTYCTNIHTHKHYIQNVHTYMTYRVMYIFLKYRVRQQNEVKVTQIKTRLKIPGGKRSGGVGVAAEVGGGGVKGGCC